MTTATTLDGATLRAVLERLESTQAEAGEHADILYRRYQNARDATPWADYEVAEVREEALGLACDLVRDMLKEAC